MPGRWTDRAACRGQTATMAMPDLHRDDGRPGGVYTVRQRAHVAAARTLCAGCPVRDECAAWALAHPDPAAGMMAGGMTPSQRRDVRNRRRVG